MGLFSLIFNIGANSSEFNQKIEHAVNTAKTGARQMEKDFLQSGNAIKTLFGGILGAGAVAGIKQVLDETGKLVDFSERLGLNPQKLSRWQQMAELVGASVEDFATANKKLVVSQIDALNGSEELRMKFGTLGVSMDDLRSKQGGELFDQIAKGIAESGMNAPKLEALLSTMGKAADSLIPLFTKGATNKVFGMDISVTDDIAESVDGVGDAFTKALQVAKSFVTFWIGFTAEGGRNVLQGLGLMDDAGGTSAPLPQPPGMIATKEQRALQAKADAEAAKQAQKDQAIADKELAAVKKREAEASERLTLSRLTPDEKRKRLDDQIADLVKVSGDFDGTSEINRRVARTKISELELERDGIKDGIKPEKALERMKTDSLLSVGNFLGSGPDRTAQELRQQTQTLQRIQQLIEQQGRTSTIRFD